MLNVNKMVGIVNSEIEIDKRIENCASLDKDGVMELIRDVTDFAIYKAKYLAFGE